MKSISLYSSLVWYGMLTLGLVVGIVFEFVFFSGRIQTLTEDENQLSEANVILTNRKNTLSALTPEVIAKSTKAAIALPSQNSALVVTAQIRGAAETNKVTLKNFTVGTYNDAVQVDIGNIQVGGIASGTSADVIAFMEEITKLSPLLAIDTLNLTANDDNTLAQFTIRSFWAPLPTKLPPITEPIDALTQAENDLLTKIDGYKIPAVDLNEVAATSSGSVNGSPFTILE